MNNIRMRETIYLSNWYKLCRTRCTPNVAKSHPAINYWTFSASVNKKKVPSGAPGWSVFRQENGRTLKVLTHKPNIITSQTQQPLQIFFTASCSIRYNLMELQYKRVLQIGFNHTIFNSEFLVYSRKYYFIQIHSLLL